MNPTEELLSEIADRLKALADPMRLRILHSLETGELPVHEIVAQVRGTQANVSKHLAVLRRAGLVAPRREGLQVYYRVADETAFTVCRTICDALEKRVEAGRQVFLTARGGDPARP